MTLQQLFYLEYFCSFFASISFCVAISCFFQERIAGPRREAGILFYKIRNARRIPAACLGYACFSLFLIGLHLYSYLSHGLVPNPMSSSNFILMGFPVIHWYRLARFSVEVHAKGLVIFHKQQFPFLAWQDIERCIWLESENRLKISTTYSSYSIPINNSDVDLAAATIGRFVEVQDEHGAIFYQGAPKDSADAENAESWTNPRQPPFQFTILSLLLLMVAVAAASGLYAVAQEYKRIQQQALEELKVGTVTYDLVGAVGTLDFTPPFPNPPPPSWPPKNLRTFSEKDLALLKSLHRLKRLYLTCTDITDAAIPDLITMQSLESLSLGSTKITPAGIERLKREMPHTEIKH